MTQTTMPEKLLIDGVLYQRVKDEKGVEQMDDDDLRGYVQRLHKSGRKLNTFETGFVDSNLRTEHFSPRQRDEINRLMRRYPNV